MKKIKSLLFYYNSISILKKFLLAPLFGLILVLPFYFFIFLIMLDMKQYVNDVNSELMPLHEISNGNILLLEKILNEMNSAVIAKEIDWVASSDKNADNIRDNLNRFAYSSYKEEIKETLSAFNNYYETSRDVSVKIINSSYHYENIENDTKNLVEKYNTIDALFKNLKNKTKTDIEKNINSLYNSTSFTLLNGNFIFLTWLLISSIVIFLVYRDLKYKIKRIIDDSNEIAMGDVDFEKRLNIVSHDELGQIIKSINIFIDKLQKNHEELSNAKIELDNLYVTDRLTNIYNRIKIDEIIDIELKKKNRFESTFSIILLDIDNFKLVNDTYGHLVGDLILKEFADILKNNIRDIDFLGRWGGEEFMIVCLQTDEKGAVALSEHLRVKIEEFNFTKVGKITA
ncbi:MAG: diguanylate cyclase, partial [Sulfurimonas sp.]|uniref:diguanylate cyclase n=1 Tax=Sulfurimonas sp. TaxID=2022749 RepID=UPI0028CEB7F0